MAAITQANFDFLKTLQQNNNRDWFNENKDLYLAQHQETIAFADALLAEMQKHDNIETLTGKKSLKRIYRDVRFRKDKSPYKNNWGIGLTRATKLLRGGYYLHIQPEASFIGGGFWSPEAPDLLKIRKDISANPDDLRKIINSKSFKDTFGVLNGDKLKTCPKGFDKEDPALDLLQYKQFLISKSFTDKEVMAPDFYKVANETFKAMRPFFDYMSYVLTTDENGETLKGL
ncbi:MAG: DUF2461 domain-containing protein [Flavobacteriales bacterium]|nr:DUF2461 domain-containing protein [Flavobacteriales bacterium]MCB9363482.1 DUF2461 domain-containing protein [Flavobacteriales bacterium]